MKKNFLLSSLLGISCILTGFAQNFPFPQNKTYSYGLMPANKSASDASAAYATWKTNFLAACNNGRYRVKFDNPSQTVSEGIGYGMLLSAYAGDKSVFDGLWLYYKDFRNSHGVMHWKTDGCSGVSGQNGATDSEVDAAMALIVASNQWTSTGTINYTADAKTLIAAIKNFEVESGSFVLKPGDMFGGSSLTNPSYFAPGYFRAYGAFTNDATFWNNVASKTYQVINANLTKNNAAGGLVSDWTKADGTYSSDAGGYANGGTRYSYDAARTPWRIAVDYVWYGNSEAKTYSQKSSDFVRINLGGSRNIKDGYYQNGTASGQWHNSTFVGAFAAAAMGGGNQTHLNDSYSDLKGINDASSYFNQTLKTLYLYLLTGNFYLPGSSGKPNPPVNAVPTASISSPANNAVYTAPASIAITANATDADGSVSKVEFFNGFVKLGEDLSSPYTWFWTNVSTGNYTLTAKATDNAGAITTSSAVSVVVNSTSIPPKPIPTGCTVQAAPPASQFVVRNPWSDNSNGSKVSDDPSGLKITHRAWGYQTLWVIQNGKQFNVTSGKNYTVKFDFLNDAANPVTSVSVGFATNDAGTPTLSQTAVAMPSGYSSSAFTNKSVSFNATASSSVYLAISLNWPGQPNANVGTFIKNLSVCETSSGTQTRSEPKRLDNSESENLSLYPNPFVNQATVYVSSDHNLPMEIQITDMLGHIMEKLQGATNQEVQVGTSLPAGSYLLKVSYGGNVKTSSLIRK